MKMLYVIIGTMAVVASGDTLLGGDRTPPRLMDTSGTETGEDRNTRGDWGACCLPDGSCIPSTMCFECDMMGGTCHYWEDCANVTCVPEPTYACCLPAGGCEEMYEQECQLSQGTYYAGQLCADAACPPPCPPSGVFADTAYQLVVDCENVNWIASVSHTPAYRDLDGDGAPEFIRGHAFAYRMFEGPVNAWITYAMPSHLVESGPSIGELHVTTLVDVKPNAMTYAGYTVGDTYDMRCVGFIDVTADGLVDAIIQVDGDLYFYAENILPPPVACTTDINSDGDTNIQDLLAVISAWGPCL